MVWGETRVNKCDSDNITIILNLQIWCLKKYFIVLFKQYLLTQTYAGTIDPHFKAYARRQTINDLSVVIKIILKFFIEFVCRIDECYNTRYKAN